MRTGSLAALVVTLVGTFAASASWAGMLEGTVRLGGIFVDEEGAPSTVQETYNLYDGFSVSQIHLGGLVDPRNYFLIDLRDLNLDSRQGELVYRRPGVLKLTAGYDRHRQVFSPDRGVDARREDWKAGAEVTAARWLNLSGSFNQLGRVGDRLAYPAGTVSLLGSEYDNSLKTGEVTAEARRGRHGGAISYRTSRYTDELNATSDRTGQVVSARLYTPCKFYDKWTHLLRGAYGVHKATDGGLDYKLADFQYTGVIQTTPALQLKYGFNGRRVDDESTRLKTDRFCNDLDATYTYPNGHVSAGYGYETNDDDRSLTSAQSWRTGTSYHRGKILSAKVDYAGRVKKDQEELTLLKDVEASRVSARLQVRPVADLVLGAGYVKRTRDLPDIGVQTDGDIVNAFGRWSRSGWGALSGDYSVTTDSYTGRAGDFDTRTLLATGRADVERIQNLRLSGGVTWLDIGRDLDIEKSLVFVEGAYSLFAGYRLEAKYNAYNYDDYILLNRYYTANVVQINVAYDFHTKGETK
jgi:hypothetical protein